MGGLANLCQAARGLSSGTDKVLGGGGLRRCSGNLDGLKQENFIIPQKCKNKVSAGQRPL